MFGLSLTHLILFGIIALIFIGPEQLPEVARTLGRIMNELRRATQDFQNQFTGQFRDTPNPFNDIRQQLSELQKTPVIHPDEPPYQHSENTPGNLDAASAATGEAEAGAANPHAGHEQHRTGHGPEAYQGRSIAVPPTSSVPSADADGQLELPLGTHPVSDDDEGKKS